MTIPDENARLFFGLPLTDQVREELAAHLRQALPHGLPGRAVPPRNWHVTLRFLGDSEPAAVRALLGALPASGLGSPFEIRFSGYGAFPRETRASVVWLGVSEGADELAGVAARLESAARAAGFPPENRPFRPHLTLARIRSPANVEDLLRRLPAFERSMPVREVVLYRSVLGGGPARYQAIEKLPL